MEDERVVTYDEGKQLAENFGILFCETSAKTGYMVKEAYEKLAMEIPSNKATQKVSW